MKRSFNHTDALEALIKGNIPAFERLFRLYYPRLKKFAVLLLKDKDEAEDLVQDVFVQIWKNREILDGERKFSSLLFTMVKNRCLNTLKRKVIQDKYALRQAKSETEELYHISFGEEEVFVSMEEKLSAELENIIAQMPDRCAEAFRLKWMEGKKNHEIALIMEISGTMVDKHLARGIRIARNLLHPDLFLFFMITRG